MRERSLPQKMNRRELMKMMLAGGVATAAGIWMPGEKLISIPSGKQFYGPGINEIGIDSMFRLTDEHTVTYVGAEDKVVNITEFFDWLKRNAAHMLSGPHDPNDLMIRLENGYRINNPEHLCNGSLAQDAADTHGLEQQREVWTCMNTMGGEDLFTDKIYHAEWDTPRERISILDTGHRGYR